MPPQRQACAAVKRVVVVADMDLETTKKALTDAKDKAFEAWVNANEDRKPLLKGPWELAEGRLSVFWKRLRRSSESACAGLLQQGWPCEVCCPHHCHCSLWVPSRALSLVFSGCVLTCWVLLLQQREMERLLGEARI